MKLLLIDDHPLVRKGLQFVLSLEKDMEVVGEASNSLEALNLLKIILLT
jgi:DNA-binding NarL/FixJ family response regulator